ncbi:allene oxide synthase-lipoxygenase protein-like [Dendronephthya gigantea]|uniref:allene oxide synthase-lipoxygenase protein-like n=1 Tax=Dendronephthya gigantea TaxID=151771 RepID=UPI001068EF8E|nr:allene oxide synthase-lipoxygenase protein-like [Dendronephthya gigantea]
MKYKITVETGNLAGAGDVFASVVIKLIGKNGTETSEFRLRKHFHIDFMRGETDTYDVAGDDVGEIAKISLKKHDIFDIKNDWYLEKVLIEKEDDKSSSYTFPCYRWIIKSVVVYEAKAILPNSKENVTTLAKQREKEVSENRELYKWGSDPRYTKDLPGFVEAKDPWSLPEDVQFTDEATASLFEVGLADFANLGLSSFYDLWESWNTLDDFRTLITPAIESCLPDAADYWRDDVWFGSQFLNGSNPEVIRKCKKLPQNFPVKNEMVNNLLDRRYNLNRAINEGVIFIVDYKILEGICTMNKPKDKRYITAAMGLFYLRKNDDLVPIAIQLGQQPGKETPIWTPQKDTGWDWIMAKLWLRCADTQYHQMITHLLRCHLMMEPTAVASWRNLPSVHPVWKLLYPHTKGIMAINTLGRSKLIPPGGVADKVLSIGGGGHIALMQRHYRNVTFESYDLKKNLTERGVKDLKKFHYKNDALLLWDAIHQFVQNIIYIYYKDDKSVQKDNEIQDWIRDLNTNGYPSGGDSVDKKIPSTFTKRDELIHFLCIVIFTCSCQHAAVNFPQMATYGFHPNSPSLMRQPPPTTRGKVDNNLIMASLANKHQAGTMVTVVKALTTIYPTEKFLGDFSDSLFGDASAQTAIANFQSELEKISQKIHERNKGMISLYTWLSPDKVPNSIAI